jgi:hypothetical protein
MDMCMSGSIGWGMVLCWALWLSIVEDTRRDIHRRLARALLISIVVSATGRKAATMGRW